jgi:signal transduction histidine kinase
MLTLAPLLVLFLLRTLRRNVRKFSPDLVWDKLLLRAMIATSVLMVVQIVFQVGEYANWFWFVVLFVLLAVSFQYPQFTPVRRLLQGIITLAVILFVSDVIETFFPIVYNKIYNVLSILITVALTWLVAMLIISNKQNKALENERRTRLEEEERHRFVEAQKIQLEQLVAERTMELTRQKEELENALVELKTTQKQLIQSEKMASLGELTAGIAHEIQNPLNFVNNFSEVSVELIDEMRDELKAGNESLVLELAKDLENNLSKISHHGKRAEAIVKGMLQHSRSSSGIREPTNINSLADEYLRLSYHGLRAKDKSFNASMKTSFDEQIGMVPVIPQDIGRVFLNLFTNAFYSVANKKKVMGIGAPYEPTVLVETKLLQGAGSNGENIVSVRVKDNGLGISQQVIDKIYQPFFTTKPSGEGTGLGLSLSYDIINKGHHGKITVSSKEGEYAEFLVEIPVVYDGKFEDAVENSGVN